MAFDFREELKKNKVLLAPMAGVSNPAYIEIVRDMGVSLFWTELISAEAIVRNNKKTFDMLDGIDKLGVKVGVQIFGSSPDVMAKAASIIVSSYDVSFIDINMGCPVPKVAIKNNAGSALLRDVDKVGKIVSSVCKAVSVPVSVKIRSGWDFSSINAPLVAKVCEENGASCIAIHARTRSQGYGGSADWNIIKEVKDSVKIPVIGNGDIKSFSDAKRMLDETGCDAVMIGRASLGNPWIFRESLFFINNNSFLPRPGFREIVDMIKKHYFLLEENMGEKRALLEIRTHALWYIKGFPNCKGFKGMITSANTKDEFFDILNLMYEENL